MSDLLDNKLCLLVRNHIPKTYFLLWVTLFFGSFAQAQQTVKLINRWKNENIGLVSGKPVSPATTNDTWVIEKTGEGEFVRIKNVASGAYLHNQNGLLDAGAIQPNWWSAQWTLKAVDGYFQIINRYKSTYIHNQNGALELGAIASSGWWSAQWKVKSTQFNYLNEETQTGAAYTANENPNAWINDASIDWMSYIPDNVAIKDISIPGTHDSGARFGGAAAQAQSWTVTKQLNAGVRYLDIRCRPTGTSFAIHHGPFFQNQMFGDVMNEVVNFLNAHPTEAVVMRIQSEHDPEAGSKSFQEIWDAYATTYKNHLFTGTNANATLGSVRGKVYILCNANCTGYGTSYNSITDIQDRYKVYWLAHKQVQDSDWATLPSKKEEIEKFIDKASSSSSWVLNHLSGAVGMIPSDVARATNNTAYEYLGQKSGKNKVGVIIMDFPGEQLIYRIIKTNFDFGSRCACAAKTFRDDSDHTWAEFRLPTGTGGQTINIAGGAYNKYVFPKCNRVYWDDLVFKCNVTSCQWEKVSGKWDADALCHGAKGDSPYVFVGDK